MASLRDFFISKVRVKLLKILLEDPAQIYYVRELVRMSEEEINAVRRELERMEQKGMVSKEKRSNRLYYGFRKDYLYYQELLHLVAKSTGLGAEIVKQKNKIGKIRFALLSGRFIRHRPHQENDVDLLIVGEVVLPQVAAIIADYEKKMKREINYSVMTKDEFEFRKKRRDPFIFQILTGSRLMLLGDEEDLVSL
jgi:Fe2+ or Zn2+ uptake regulation protein